MALTDPKAAESVSDAVFQLGGQLKAVAPETVPSPGIATAVTKLGGLLVRAKAQRKARDVALAADPAMADIFQAMAETVGRTSEEGLRGTALANWQLLMAAKQVAYLALTQGDGKATADRKITLERRALATEFADLLARRNAQDAALASLGQSYLALSRAHHALAVGSFLDLARAVAIVKDEAESTRALYERFARMGSSEEGP